jgi:hypothetical protein
MPSLKSFIHQARGRFIELHRQSRQDVALMNAPFSRAPVSSEASGQLRMLLAGMEAGAAIITRAVAKIPSELFDGSRWKGRVGTARAIERICSAMPRAPDHRTDRVAIWRYLQPLVELPGADDDDQRRSGVMMFGIIAERKRRRRRIEPFGIAFTTHAIGRLIDRSNFTADPERAMFDSHDALMALPALEFDRAFNLPDIVLPAAGGMFLARSRRIGLNDAPLMVCNTWVHADQAFQTQQADLSAWATFMGLDAG